MKTKEELTAVKEKAETMNEKDRKLTEEELLLCSGGFRLGHLAGIVVGVGVGDIRYGEGVER